MLRKNTLFLPIFPENSHFFTKNINFMSFYVCFPFSIVFLIESGENAIIYVTICRILHENRVQIRSSKRDIGIDLREKASFICESYHEGMLVKEIANQLGYSMASIYRILHENNVATEGKKHSVEHRKKNSEAQLGMSQEQLIFLIQWYSGWGWSQRRIARELRKGERTIAKYAKLAK